MYTADTSEWLTMEGIATAAGASGTGAGSCVEGVEPLPPSCPAAQVRGAGPGTEYALPPMYGFPVAS